MILSAAPPPRPALTPTKLAELDMAQTSTRHADRTAGPRQVSTRRPWMWIRRRRSDVHAGMRRSRGPAGIRRSRVRQEFRGGFGVRRGSGSGLFRHRRGGAETDGAGLWFRAGGKRVGNREEETALFVMPIVAELFLARAPRPSLRAAARRRRLDTFRPPSPPRGGPGERNRGPAGARLRERAAGWAA